jgi:RNA polymerase sigma-B factor
MTDRDSDEVREALFDELEQTGSTRARDALIESYTPLADYFARRYRGRGAEDDDLRQVARLGLVNALDRFDRSVGVKFSTFAGRTIDGELKRHFRDRTWSLRVPRSLKQLSTDVRRAGDELTAELGRAPTVKEIADRIGADEDLVIEALDVQSAYRPKSLDQRAGDSDGAPLHSTIGSSDRGLERAELRMAVDALLETLPERERDSRAPVLRRSVPERDRRTGRNQPDACLATAAPQPRVVALLSALRARVGVDAAGTETHVPSGKARAGDGGAAADRDPASAVAHVHRGGHSSHDGEASTPRRLIPGRSGLPKIVANG